jgi:EF-P beta-lysylation protein EpmB
MAQAIRDPEQLLQALQLSKEQLPAALQAAETFSLRVPHRYVQRMRIGDPADPLLLQVLPQGEELTATPGFKQDPVGDMEAMASPGLLHKYHGRCLLVVTGACAVHCRYCFRRHFPYQEAKLDSQALEQAYQYISENSDITELILSGGDPLALSDRRLEELIERISQIPHLQRLRIHTRLPVVLPNRITDELIRITSDNRLKTIWVFHFNHANEINREIINAIQPLRQNGHMLLNQSVLLRGVNDSVEALTELSEALFNAGILPYYLHLLDRVSGASHF